MEDEQRTHDVVTEIATEVATEMLALRPGVEVLRREPGRLQLGLGPEAMVVSDSAAVRRLLAGLRGGWGGIAGDPAADLELRAVLERLTSAGLVVESRAWSRDRARWPRLAAAAYARRPGTAAEALLRRSETRVGVSAPEAWLPELTELLGANGLEAAGSAEAAVNGLHLLAASGEPPRDQIDPLVAAGVPHLLLRASAGRLSLGPFVEPGHTACLRCEDAHRTDADPRWPLLLAQLSPTTPDDFPPEPALLSLALAWAVRDLSAYAEGERPATWSTTISVEPELTLPRRELRRHPHCGCTWGDLLATG